MRYLHLLKAFLFAFMLVFIAKGILTIVVIIGLPVLAVAGVAYIFFMIRDMAVEEEKDQLSGYKLSYCPICKKRAIIAPGEDMCILCAAKI